MFDVVLAWEAFKVWLSDATGLSHHTYHFLLGILLTLTLTWVLRLPLRSWIPVSIVSAAELVNEAFDFTRYYVDGYPWGPVPMFVDIAITVIPPLVMVIAARFHHRGSAGPVRG